MGIWIYNLAYTPAILLNEHLRIRELLDVANRPMSGWSELRRASHLYWQMELVLALIF